MASERLQMDPQHMEAILNEMQILHERITHLEGIMDMLKKGAEAVKKVAKTAAKKAQEAGKVVVETSKNMVKAGKNTVPEDNTTYSQRGTVVVPKTYNEQYNFDNIDKIVNIICNETEYKKEEFSIKKDDTNNEWRLELRLDEKRSLRNVISKLHQKYNDLYINFNSTNLLILVKFDHLQKQMEQSASDITAYSQAVLRQLDTKAGDAAFRRVKLNNIYNFLHNHFNCTKPLTLFRNINGIYEYETQIDFPKFKPPQDKFTFTYNVINLLEKNFSSIKFAPDIFRDHLVIHCIFSE